MVILGTTFLFAFNAVYKMSSGQVGLKANSTGQGYIEYYEDKPLNKVPLWAIISLVLIVGTAVITCMTLYVK